MVGLAAVLGVFLFVVFYFNVSIYRKINKLAYRHARIHTHGLLYRNLQRPVAAKAHVAFAGRGMNVNAQAACGRFAFKKRHVRMRFGVFRRHAEIKHVRLQHKAFFRDFKKINAVVLFGVQHFIFIFC